MLALNLWKEHTHTVVFNSRIKLCGTHTPSFSEMCNGFWLTMWCDNMKGAIIDLFLLTSHKMWLFLYEIVKMCSFWGVPPDPITVMFNTDIKLMQNYVQYFAYLHMKCAIIEFLLLISHKMWLFKYGILKSVQLLGGLPPDPITQILNS